MRLRSLLVASLPVLFLSACGGSTDGGGDVPDGGPNADDSAPNDTGSNVTDGHMDAPTSDGALDSITDSARDGLSSDAHLDAPVDGTLVFVGDFETGDLSQWPSVEECAKGRVTVYDATSTADPPPHQGKYAAHFHVLDTDVSPCTSTDNPRAQLSTKMGLFKPGDDFWEAWSLYVPTTFPTLASDKWLLFQEDYGPPWDGPPQIGWDIVPIGGTLSFAMSRGAQYGVDTAWHEPVVQGAWVDFLVHKKFSNTLGGGGFVEAWIDGKSLPFAPCGGCTKLDMQTMHSTQSELAFFQNLYRAHGAAPVIDLYFDRVLIGTTRAIVESTP